jgi:putative transposase
VKRAYKMRVYPTTGQQRRGHALIDSHCELYNAALEERTAAWKWNRKSVSYGTQSAQLKEIRAVRPDLAVWSFTAQQQTLRRLKRSFDGFFRRCKNGETPGYPRFKSRRRFDTVDHDNGDGSKWMASQGRWAHAYFQGVGTLKVSEHTRVQGRVTQISLRREFAGRRWYVIVIADSVSVSLPPTGRNVGVDVGIARFLTTSDGGTVGNPRFLKSASDDLADLQHRRAACKRGSGNSKRLKRQIARLHRQVTNRRRDFHHKTANALVVDYDVIAVEDLNIKNMTRRAKPKPDPNTPGAFLPNGGAAKTGLNRSIADVGWNQFLGILTAKAAWAGRQVIPVNPAYTSIDCHRCGRRCTRPQQDTVVCPVHGPLDADRNGAINIYTRAGLGSGQVA